LSSLQDVSVSSVSSWLVGLSSMSSDSRLLGVDTKLRMAEMSLKYLESCGELGLSMEDVGGAVGLILDLILDVGIDLDSAKHNTSSSSSSELVLSLLDAYNDFIQSNLVVGQRPVSVLNRLFRSSHHSLDLNEGGVMNLTLSPPRSELEEYLGSPSQQATFPLDVLLGVSKVSIVESQFTKEFRMRNSGLDSNTSSPTANQIIATRLLSIPLELRFDSTPCNSSISTSNSSCVTRITLHKVIEVVEHPSDDHPEFLELKCEKGDHSTTHNFTCQNGDVLNLSCNGSSGVLRGQCPVHNMSTVCVSLLDNQDCKLISNEDNDNEDHITCECSLANTSPKTNEMNLDGTAATINFGVMTRSLSHEFVSTWLSADDLSGGEVLSNLTVLFSTVGVSLLGGLVMFLSLLWDRQDSAHRTKAASLGPKLISDRSIFKNPSSMIKRSLSPHFSSLQLSPISMHTTPKKTRFKYHVIGLKEEKQIEESLPLVMRPVPLLDKCKNEMKMYHRWLGVYYHYSSSYSRPLRVLSLWINIVTMLFVQSMLYNLADPDDGRCERQETMLDCLRLKSSLSNSAECVWQSDMNGLNNQSQLDLMSEGICSFRPIDHDFDRVLIVAMLSGILSSPFSIFFQSLILFVLAAKTKNSSNYRNRSISVESDQDLHQSRFLRDPSRKQYPDHTLASNLQDDFGKLLTKLRLYRDGLSSAEREEFECESSLPSFPWLPSSFVSFV
jgi:hypothetical protein